MKRRCSSLLNVVLVLLAGLPPAAAAEGGRKPAQAGVHVTSNGLKLSLIVPRPQYARGSLVRVRIRVQNLSDQLATVPFPCPNVNPPDAPTAQVLGRTGRVIYPPALKAALPSPYMCNPPPPEPLRPGSVVERDQYVILRSGRMRATTALELPRAVPGVPAVRLTTPVLLLHLTAGRGPSASLRSSPTVHVEVASRATRPRGGLHYIDWYRCPPGEESTRSYDVWTVASGSQLWPGCPHPLEWRVIAGWLNQPVVVIHYVEPGMSHEVRRAWHRGEPAPRCRIRRSRCPS